MDASYIINLSKLNQGRMAMQIGEDSQDTDSSQGTDTSDNFYSLMQDALQDARAGLSGSSAGAGVGALSTAGNTQSSPSNANYSQTVPAEIASLVEGAAKKYGIDAKLIYNVIKAESSFHSNAVSKAGAQGLMQLMPSTAATYGVKDAFDPVQNIDGGARLLRDLTNKYDGNTELVLAAYNAGVGAVAKYKGVPPFAETQNYVSKIMKALQ